MHLITINHNKLRLNQIQKWLGFSDQYLEVWIKLSTGFLNWLHEQIHQKKMEEESMNGTFPQLWKKYLQETNQSDQVNW